MGTILTCVVGLIYCAITGFNDPTTVDSKLLAPIMRRFAKPKNNLKFPDIRSEEDFEFSSVLLKEINR